jgi:hypothetical protein
MICIKQMKRIRSKTPTNLHPKILHSEIEKSSTGSLKTCKEQSSRQDVYFSLPTIQTLCETNMATIGIAFNPAQMCYYQLAFGVTGAAALGNGFGCLVILRILAR